MSASRQVWGLFLYHQFQRYDTLSPFYFWQCLNWFLKIKQAIASEKVNLKLSRCVRCSFTELDNSSTTRSRRRCQTASGLTSWLWKRITSQSLQWRRTHTVPSTNHQTGNARQEWIKVEVCFAGGKSKWSLLIGSILLYLEWLPSQNVLHKARLPRPVELQAWFATLSLYFEPEAQTPPNDWQFSLSFFDGVLAQARTPLNNWQSLLRRRLADLYQHDPHPVALLQAAPWQIHTKLPVGPRALGSTI